MILLFSGGTSQAKVIQILHTNDLHASLNVSGASAPGEETYGGWAQIKTVMDALTIEAESKDIETVRLDAGDFFEGTLSYFPDLGTNVLKAYQTFGYDAVTLGNHDWLMGARNTDRAFGRTPFPFPVLGANIEISPELKNLSSQVRPSTQIIKGGVKIGVFGLSTDEIFYKWITKVDSKKCDMKIYDYRDWERAFPDQTVLGIANAEAEKLKQENDLVIALTHIGFKEDSDLARSSRDIDLIVGGHSHTLLESLALVENADGRSVPIVQTGSTGVFIGKILVDVVRGKKPQVLSYELVPVYHDYPTDPVMKDWLDVSEKRLMESYGDSRLNQVIGTSETELVSGSSGKTAYSKFVVDAMKETTGSDLAIDMGEFHSNSAQEGGDITLRKLMEMYPRKLNADQNEGLSVYQFRIPGWALRLALKLSIQYGYTISTSGVEYQTRNLSDEEFQQEKSKVKDSWKALALTRERLVKDSIRINGKKLKLFRKYRVAAPEFLVRGAYAISSLTRLVLRNGKPTPFTIWEASQRYLSKIKVIENQPGFLRASAVNANVDYPYARDFIGNILQNLQITLKKHPPKDLNDQDHQDSDEPKEDTQDLDMLLELP